MVFTFFHLAWSMQVCHYTAPTTMFKNLKIHPSRLYQWPATLCFPQKVIMVMNTSVAFRFPFHACVLMTNKILLRL